MNLTTATPAQIDEVWAGLQGEYAAAVAALATWSARMENALERKAAGNEPWHDWDATIASYEAKAATAGKLAQAKLEEMAPFVAEYNARGGWTRGYLVPNGHVHSSTHCQTCFPTTKFLWCWQVSGLPEAEIVDMAGEAACTVCYPSAPVESTSKPCRLEEPAKIAARNERAAKAAAKAAAAVLNPVTGQVMFKTARGATNHIASQLGSMVHYGPTHPSFTEWQTEVHETIDALVAKGEVPDAGAYYEAALVKARKACEAEHRKWMRESGDHYRRQGMLDPAVDEPGYSPVKF